MKRNRSIRLCEKDWAILKGIAKKEDRSLNNLVMRILQNFIKAHEKSSNQHNFTNS